MKDNYDFTKAERGAVVESVGKTRITIFLDKDVLTAFRERAAREGIGYQTLINNTLRTALAPESVPITLDALRRVLREELHAA